jgi:tetratricopeptide (TPR) repeat protein
MAENNSGSTSQQRLDSWKEIGAYFGRDERTVKRWERERGLPVHRVPGSGRGRVYAYPAELAEWLQGAGEALAGEIGLAAAAAAGPIGNSGKSMTPAEMAAARNPPPSPAKPPGSAYSSLGFRPSGDSSARMPDPVPRLSLVHRAAPSSASAAPAAPDFSPAATQMAAHAAAPPHSRATAWRIAGVCVLIGLACLTAEWDHRVRQNRADAITDSSANSQAENLYLQGKFFWQQRTPESLTKAVDLFTQAIVHDPNYAPAYAGLAECYELLREFSNMPDDQAFPRALSAAQQAVKLNPNLAQGHAALAFAQFWWSWDTQGALREFARALELDPNAAQTHHWYATSLITLGRGKEALEQIDRAQQLDPGSRAIMADKGFILMLTGRTEEARTLLLQLEQSDPQFVSPHQYLAHLAQQQGDGDEFARETRLVAALLHDPARAQIADIAQAAYRAGGRTAMDKALNDHVRDAYRKGNAEPGDMARVLAQDGDRDGAFRLLDEAYARRDPNLRSLLTDPVWTSYRGDPRFIALQHRLGVALSTPRAE